MPLQHPYNNPCTSSFMCIYWSIEARSNKEVAHTCAYDPASKTWTKLRNYAKLGDWYLDPPSPKMVEKRENGRENLQQILSN